jgi:serine/threonine-protein kinase PpkA
MQVPGYTIERLLGQGNIASAYLARGATDNRPIVLKIIDLNTSLDKDLLKRFIQEYNIISRVEHPNVVHIEERGFGGDFAFIAMEYCAFGSLKTHIAKRAISPPEALRLAQQIAAGLGAVHDIGVAHRDMKPANLLFRDPRTLVLTDFGVAKDLSNAAGLTARGSFVGSVYYCSPEQISTQTSGPLSDLYSVGVILFQMLTGRPPFIGKTATESLEGHLHAPIPRLPASMAVMQPLIDGLLAKETYDRFQSAKDLVSGIAWTAQRLVPPRPDARRAQS